LKRDTEHDERPSGPKLIEPHQVVSVGRRPE
jgi:hypothetical protein